MDGNPRNGPLRTYNMTHMLAYQITLLTQIPYYVHARPTALVSAQAHQL